SCCACATTDNNNPASTPTSAQSDTTTNSDNDVSSVESDVEDELVDTDDDTSSEKLEDTDDESGSSTDSKPTSSNTSSKNESNNTTSTSKPGSSKDPDKTTSSDTSSEEVVSSAGSSTCSHTYKAATCTKPKTCTKCGKTSGSKLGHSYKEATCTRPKTCTVCGTMSGNALGHNYVLGECTICKDYSKSYCPKLYFTGDMSQITDPKQTSKKIECDIDVQYRSREQIVNCTAKIKIQGSSSTQYAKKNYTINFYEDSTYGSKKKINVGWGAQSKYCLKANWIDKTHSRNVVTAKLGAQMQAKYGLFNVAPHHGTVDGFPVEIYINGEFHGLYTMNIPKDEWMFGMDKNNPNHIVICGENWNDPVLFKSIPTDLKDWTVEAGPEDDATLQKVQRLVKFVKDSSDAEFKANFDQYLNFDSTINYYIMMNCAWLSDNAGKNMLLATYDGKVWYPTLYDLDTSWGTHWKGTSLYNYSSGVINGSNSLLWQRIEKLYKKEIAARYFELRQSVLSKENIMAEFNNFKTSIPKEVLDRETAKWNTAEHPIPGYDVSQIEEYINIVFPRLDNRFSGWK
ncbi:MAG: CotH kinase family protein, partial [Clostridia bacterium]|nr:CotH kinase family protein [Clostridia bacterium]